MISCRRIYQMAPTYFRPKSIDEAISFCQRYGEEAQYIAGGTDLMVKIKDKQIRPRHLISLKSIPGLDHIGYENGELKIGALTTHRRLELSPVIRRHFPILTDAVENIGSVQIRNVATIGGNIVNAVPSADGATPLITLGAKVRLVGPRGERTMALEDIFTGPGQTLLEHGEILYEFIIPPLPLRTGAAYWKHRRRAAMELPILGVAVLICLAEDMRTCVEARIGLGVMAPTPMRAKNAERVLKGKKVDDQILERAGKTAASESKPRDTARGEAWYRREMVEVLVPRVGKVAMERAKQSSF
jgi:carbon-monoxide dehydrogenase medium subunit